MYRRLSNSCKIQTFLQSEPVFVNIYGAQESILPAYVAWRASTTNRVVVPTRQAGNRFLGSLKGLVSPRADLVFINS
jgi:hypothetical protein